MPRRFGHAAREIPHAACVLALSLTAGAANAQTIGDTLSFSAGDVQADPNLRELSLRDHVVVTYGRYRIVSDSLHLALTPGGIMVDGDGRVAFCPCPDPPVAIAFSGGRVAPPGDLVVRFPRLEVLGLPVFALPWIWIRAPDRVGLLPPMLSWRGDDGLLAGAGVHVPWRGQGGALRELDVRAGGYFEGGAEVSAAIKTPSSTTRASIDEIHGTRVVADARGALEPERDVTLAWDLDAIRGDRARSGTIELAPAAQAYDAGSAESALRFGGGRASSAVAAVGVTGRAWRGEGEAFIGPHAAVAFGGDAGSVGAWDGALMGLTLGRARAGGDAVSVGAASLGTELSARPGPFAVRAGVRGRARVADPGPIGGASQDAAAALRLEASLPVARAWNGPAGEAPTVHTIAPVVEARGAMGGASGTFFAPFGPVPRLSWLAGGGVSSSLGRYDGSAARIDLRAGATGVRGVPAATGASGATATGALTETGAPLTDAGEVLPVAHARLVSSWRALALGIEAAIVGLSKGAFEVRKPPGEDPGRGAADERAGAAAIGRARLGPQAGPWLGVDAAVQSGTGAADARGVAEGAAASIPGDDLPYLGSSGWTGGAGAMIPWTRTWDTSVRADADLGSGDLLGIHGAAGYHHPCGCVAFVANVAHRVGRGGVDVWVSINLVPRTH